MACGYSHFRETIEDSVGGNHSTEALDLVVLHALLEALSGSNGLCHTLGEIPLQQCIDHHQTLPCQCERGDNVNIVVCE